MTDQSSIDRTRGTLLFAAYPYKIHYETLRSFSPLQVLILVLGMNVDFWEIYKLMPSFLKKVEACPDYLSTIPCRILHLSYT